MNAKACLLAAVFALGLSQPRAQANPPTAASTAAPAPTLKVLRIASESETGFDPARVGDARSIQINAHLFEPLLGYDPLARPVKLVPKTAAALPEGSADFRTWTVRLKPGITFSDDPAFGGKPRELVAQDYAYAIKRLADPANKSPAWSEMEQVGISGLLALRREALQTKAAFDYQRAVPGIEVLDRHTLRFHLDAPRPRFPFTLAESATAAVAREVIEAATDTLQRPVGTGPFVLKEWRRASRIVLERSPSYREVRYHAEPAAHDAAGQALLARFKGRRLPMIDRVEVAIIDEPQPRWLAFLRGELDWITLPDQFTNLALPHAQLAPHLAKRGIQAERVVMPSTYYTMFNMEHPLVGGYAAPQVALRRAIGLGVDVPREINQLRNGSAVAAQSPVAVHMSGYDAAWRSEMSEYNPTKARALLDLFGYVDRDGDGWRETPQGQPLLLEMATQPSQETRQYDELMRRDMTAIGLRIVFRSAAWPEQYKAARAGKLMMWSVSGRASAPDGLLGLLRYEGAAAGGMNLSRFNLPAMNEQLARLLALPDGPEREAVFEQAKRLTVAWMPYKLRTHLVQVALSHPQLVGYRRPLFWANWFDVVDIEPQPLSRP